MLTWIAALYFVGGVRVTFSTGIAAGGNLAYWYLPYITYDYCSKQQKQKADSPQDKLPRHHGLHLHHRRRGSRGMLCLAVCRLHLSLGC